MTLFVIDCNDLTVIVLKMYKEAAVISALMKVCSVPCHDRGHINVMLVLQSCTDCLQVLPGSSSETFPVSSDDACNFSNIEVEEDVVVVEEGFIAVNEEASLHIKGEEIAEDTNFSDMKSEPDEVSYVCICLLLDTFYQCPEMSVVFVMSVFLANCTATLLGMKMICYRCFIFGNGGRVCTKWVGLRVIAEKPKIYSYLQVVKNPYPQDDS